MSLAYEIRPLAVKDMEIAHPLFVAHYDELTTNKSIMVLDPDWETYQALHDTGKLLILGAYHGDKLAGYSVNIVASNLHYRGLVMCSNDLLFVHPDYRESPLGLRLMAKTREHARALGAKLMLWHAKQGSTLDKLLTRKRTKVQDIIFSEII